MASVAFKYAPQNSRDDLCLPFCLSDSSAMVPLLNIYLSQGEYSNSALKFLVLRLSSPPAV